MQEEQAVGEEIERSIVFSSFCYRCERRGGLNFLLAIISLYFETEDHWGETNNSEDGWKDESCALKDKWGLSQDNQRTTLYSLLRCCSVDTVSLWGSAFPCASSSSENRRLSGPCVICIPVSSQLYCTAPDTKAKSLKCKILKYQQHTCQTQLNLCKKPTSSRYYQKQMSTFYLLRRPRATFNTNWLGSGTFWKLYEVLVI